MEHVRLESAKTIDMGSGTDTSYFEAIYPVFDDKDVQALVLSHVLGTDEEGTSYQDVAQEGKAFIKDFDANNQDEPYPRPWFLQKKLRVAHNTPHYLAFDFSFSQYTGGAHGNYGTLYKNYYPQEKDSLRMADIIKEQELPIFLKSAERAFRHQERLTKNQSLDDEYFFEDGKFALNDNFVLDEKGILFLYNVYEIKPYSSGVTKIHIPYQDIEHIMTDRGKQIRQELQKD